MNCDDAYNLLNARLDGEITPSDEAALQAHLADCAACRVTDAELRAQHARLRDAFADHRAAAHRVADRVLAQRPPLRRRLSILPWLSAIASAAAGFLIAWAIFRAPIRPQAHQVIATQPATRPAAVAHLTLATGEVECCAATSSQWSALPTGGAVPAGTRLRTGPAVRCEFRLNDGSEVRLDENTELTIASPRRFDLASGQAWSSVSHRDPAAGQPFQAVAQAVTFTALGTQFDLQSQPAEVTLTVAEGRVRAVAGGASEVVVPAGQALTCPDGHLGDPRPVRDLTRATRWLNEILVMKGRDDPELAQRIDDLFAQIGESKMGFMYEDEIRALGDHCVIPLTRYIESSRSAGQDAKRVTAARIVADVAPPWAIPELLKLLNDENGQVRAEAARALRRLTGQTMGRSVEQWQQDSLFQCAPSVQDWDKWWRENRGKYPGVGRGQGEVKKG